MKQEEAYKFTSDDAENYDYYLGPILFEPYGKYLASRIDRASVYSVLELACGTGRVTGYIREALPAKAGLTATDISNDMLDIAKRKLGSLDVSFQTEDIQNLSFPNDKFDLAICQFGMMFLSDKQKGFSEIYRVLKPGGKLLCFTWNDTIHNPLFHLLIDELLLPYFPDEDTTRFFVPFSLHDPRQLNAWMQQAGFKNIETETVDLVSGSSSPEHVRNAFYLKHPLGKTMQEKKPSDYEAVGERLKWEVGKRYGADAYFPCPQF